LGTDLEAITMAREQWPQYRGLPELTRPGLYVLTGFGEEEDDDLRKIYVGQSERLCDRLESHYRAADKKFVEQIIAFVRTNPDVGFTGARWIEHALIDRGFAANRCHMVNDKKPVEPPLGQVDKILSRTLLQQILQILPLVDVRAFDLTAATGPVIAPAEEPADNPVTSPAPDDRDTMIVPARDPGFTQFFLKENRWRPLRIAPAMRESGKIKWVGAYQVAPVSAVTHLAPVDRIIPYGEDGKWEILFSQPATAIDHIVLGKLSPAWMKNHKYTSRERLLKAKTLAEVTE
jgi:hypothetical protein